MQVIMSTQIVNGIKTEFVKHARRDATIYQCHHHHYQEVWSSRRMVTAVIKATYGKCKLRYSDTQKEIMV